MVSHPVAAQLQVAPGAQWMTQPPPSQDPIVQVSPSPHSRVQPPPGQAAMTRADGSSTVPTRWILQPPSVHSSTVQSRPR